MFRCISCIVLISSPYYSPVNPVPSALLSVFPHQTLVACCSRYDAVVFLPFGLEDLVLEESRRCSSPGTLRLYLRAPHPPRCRHLCMLFFCWLVFFPVSLRISLSAYCMWRHMHMVSVPGPAQPCGKGTGSRAGFTRQRGAVGEAPPSNLSKPGANANCDATTIDQAGGVQPACRCLVGLFSGSKMWFFLVLTSDAATMEPQSPQEKSTSSHQKCFERRGNIALFSWMHALQLSGAYCAVMCVYGSPGRSSARGKAQRGRGWRPQTQKRRLDRPVVKDFYCFVVCMFGVSFSISLSFFFSLSLSLSIYLSIFVSFVLSFSLLLTYSKYIYIYIHVHTYASACVNCMPFWWPFLGCSEEC